MASLVDAATIERKAKDKQFIEDFLARSLYKAFNDEGALRPLRATVKVALKAMVSGPYHASSAACQKERFLDVWKHVGGASGTGLLRLAHSADRFTAADCSDVIRLLGEWIEQGGLGEAGQLAKEAFRPGVRHDGTAGLGAPNAKVHAASKAAAWADGKKYKWGSGDKADSITLDYRKHAKVRDREDAPKGGFPLPAPVRKRPGQGTAGRELKKVTGKSNVLKIDRVFGLSELCDISGTTADSTFAVEVWGHEGVNKVANLSEIYYMLPLATMPASGHHSILEVALVLSLNGTVEGGYRVGFYTTLLPRKHMAIPAALKRISFELLRAESIIAQNELHFLRYYKGTAVAGGIVLAGKDIPAFRNSLLSSATKLLAYMPHLREYPTLDDVCRLCRNLAPNFFMHHVRPALPGA